MIVIEYGPDGKVASQYKGELKNGLYHGKGAMLKFDSMGRIISKYEGEFINGTYDGEGTLHEYDENRNLKILIQADLKTEFSRARGRW